MRLAANVSPVAVAVAVAAAVAISVLLVCHLEAIAICPSTINSSYPCYCHIA